MKDLISKKPIGSILNFLKPKSQKIRVSIIIFTSLLLFSAIPYFSGPGLLTPKIIGPYANNTFPESADLSLDAGYRIAFPNLTFFVPITFNTVPNQNKIVIGQLNGLILTFDNDESIINDDVDVLLDLTGEVGLVSDGGFLGLTIHPDFDAPTNPQNYFYIYYATKNALGEDSPGFGQFTNQSCTYSEDQNEYQGNFLILERFEVDPLTMSVVANSRTTILKNRMYGTTHYGGGLQFGDDGFLYLTTGDMASWYRSQNISNNLSGGLLRLDVDKDPTKSHPPVRTKPVDAGFSDEITGVEYWIPNDNPFSDSTPGSTTSLYGQLNLTTPDPIDVYQSGDFFEEYYSIGLRNPFRMTKDRLTGDFYVGDVGLNTHEEINVIEPGANYGWPEFEGFINGPGCDANGNLFNLMPHEQPLTAFAPEDANSITGGFVYRGTDIPELYGTYLCADYGSGNEIYSVNINSGNYVQIATVPNIVSFGEDNDGEIYLLSLGANFGQTTTLFKLIDDDVNTGTVPQSLSETGIFSDLTNLDIIDGFVPYDLYESFWSDGALKRRWIAIPNTDGIHSGANEQINYSEYSDWEFPEGTVIVKHFDLRIDDNDPSVTRKIETRISVVGAGGEMYYLTYNWNENETDALLQTTTLNEPIDITTTTGGTRTQLWHFPSNSECVDCHNEANKGVLGLKSRYLNTDYTYDETGITANQLVTLSHLGILNATITDTDTPDIITNRSLTDTNATLDEKARSYLDLNCAYCHRHDNDNRAEFDLRYFNSLEATELLTSGILSPLGIAPDEEIVFPGDANKSILYHRMNSVDPSIMMPPLSKTIIDQPAVTLVEQWINQLDPNSIIDYQNSPNPVSNLALLESAQLSGYNDTTGSGRGAPIDILYDPSVEDYKVITQFSEYGVPFNGSGNNLGTVDADNGFYWQVDWPSPKFVNYITFGGAYPNQRQEFTMWRVSYLRDDTWHTIEEGQGGWIDNDTGQNFVQTAIYEWDGTNQTPVYAEALRLQLFSDGVNDLFRIHLRGRGGNTQFSNGQDLNTEPKASLIQFLPFNAPTTINNVSAGIQTSCDNLDNTYSQQLTVTYTNEPETGSLIVNGQTFPITGSPQIVTLTDLDSDGLDVEVEANFTDGYQSEYKSNATVFTAPISCTNILVGVDEIMVIDGDHNVAIGQSIQVMEGGSLTINGNLTVSGQVTLYSTSTKYSSLIVNGTSTGSIEYRRHVNAYNGASGNDLISSPLKNEDFGSFAGNNPNIFENPSNPSQKLFGPFNEVTDNYEIYSTVTNAATNFVGGMGYRAARDSSEDGVSGTTFTFNGEIETNSVTIPITSTVNGWNLIGNPYSSYLDFDAFFALNQSELDVASFQAIYGYDGNAQDGWEVLNNTTTGRLIAPGQGFFVKSKTGGGTITFTPAMRTSGNTDDFIQGRASSAHNGYLKLMISSNTSNYSTDFYFNDNATLGLDPGYDAAIFGGSPPNFSIYSNLVEENNGTAYAIQALESNAINNVIVPLGINALQGQSITISIDETDIPDDIDIYLEDSVNNTFTLLTTSDFNFTPNENLTGVGRFYLHFGNTTLSTADAFLDKIDIFTNSEEKTIIIRGLLESNTSFKLYDIHGRLIISSKLDATINLQSIDVSAYKTGIYIVELVSEANKKRIEKLIIR